MEGTRQTHQNPPKTRQSWREPTKPANLAKINLEKKKLKKFKK